MNLPGARMHTAMRQASKLVDTARRDPLGMSFTLLTISMPCPGRPVNRSSTLASGSVVPSIPGGRMPEAITEAFNSPR